MGDNCTRTAPEYTSRNVENTAGFLGKRDVGCNQKGSRILLRFVFSSIFESVRFVR